MLYIDWQTVDRYQHCGVNIQVYLWSGAILYFTPQCSISKLSWLCSSIGSTAVSKTEGYWFESDHRHQIYRLFS